MASSDHIPGHLPAYSDAAWNANHHAMWMAYVVAHGMDPKLALQLAYAHELDSDSYGHKTFGSLDEKIDMINNALGIKIGQKYLQDEMVFGLHTDRVMAAQISAAASPTCTSGCLDLDSRYDR